MKAQPAMGLTAAALASALLFGTALSVPSFRDILPHDWHAMYQKMQCNGAGHATCEGGPGYARGVPVGGEVNGKIISILNTFGEALQRAGLVSNGEDCEGNADGDGRTDGEELVSPNCTGNSSTNETPTRTSDITPPDMEDGATTSSYTKTATDFRTGVAEAPFVPAPPP